MLVNSAPPEAGFFITGGTIPPGALSYVERAADGELFEALSAGEFCYVLNSRQMGKSSLAVRTMGRLADQGIRCAFVDLTKIGARGVSEEQWYAGILSEVARTLGLRGDLLAYLRIHAAVSPSQRLFGFLQEVVATGSAPAVVLFDEVDAVRSLSFSADAFFIGIRQCGNARSTEPQLKNLTFCLLGAALPGDLIQDARSTPFNIGRRIELRDFTDEEARPFVRGLGDASLLARILHWTGGHPFLTQALCAELAAEAGDRSLARVDAIVQARYLDHRAREADTNLADVGNRILGRGDPNVGDAERADTLSLHAKLLASGIPDDESNPACARIKMSGVARLENGRLGVRNRIYRHVFGREWIRQNMPGQELRRQRRAFWRGALRTGGIAATVIAVVGYLAWNNARLARIAEDRRRSAEYDAYVAGMQTMPLALAEGNFEEIERKLTALANNPARGWEWNYWSHVVHNGAREMHFPDFVFGDGFTSDGRYLVGVSTANDRLAVVDLNAGSMARTFPIKVPEPGKSTKAWFADQDRRIVVTSPGGWLSCWDSNSGRELARKQFLDVVFSNRPPVGHDELVGLEGYDAVWVSAQSLTVVRRIHLPPRYRAAISASPDGKRLAWFEIQKSAKNPFAIVIARADDGKEVDRVSVSLGSSSPVLSPDDRTVAYADGRGEVMARDYGSHLAEGHRILVAGISSIRFSPDGRMLLVCGTDRRATLYDLRANKNLREFPDAYFAAYTPSGRSIYTEYRTLRVYDAAAQPDSTEYRPVKPWSSPTLTYSGHAAGWAAGVGSIVDLTRDGFPAKTFPIAGPLAAIWFNERDAIRLNHDSVEVMRLGAKPDLRLPLPPQAGLPLGISPDGRWVVYLRSIYDRWKGSQSDKPVARLPQSALTSVVFSEDGKWLLTGDQTGLVVLWRVGDWGRPLWEYRDRTLGILSDAEFSPDGTRIALAMAIDDGVIVDARSGRLLLRLVGHAQKVNTFAWSPDARRLATGSDDQTVRLWDSETGRQLCIVGRQEEAISDVIFLPGGRTIASLGKSVKLWESADRR